jgi:ANTAR domain
LLACQLPTPRGTLGSLNLYASEPYAFGTDSVLICRAIATHASIALARADREQELQRAIDSGGLIGQAMSILMARDHYTAGTAFETLLADSLSHEVTLSEVAGRLVESAADGDVGPAPLTLDR